MSSIRTRTIDVLSDPRLAEARERVRRLGRYATGVQTRLRPLGRGEHRAGMLSIVVPMYGVERYIDQCLQSLSQQRYWNIEVIAVDDCSPDRSLARARMWALRDPRVHVVRRARNGGLSAARNTGVAHAHGEYLAFLDSDDFVERRAYSDAIASLQQTGSDFAVLPYRREFNGAFKGAAAWIRQAHSMVRKRVTLDEFPLIMVNATAWSKVYRRSFWDACGFAFPTGVVYEDQALSMAAYARARTFDVLARTSVNWRIRDDQSSITQQLTSARNIRDHLVAARDSFAALEEYGSAKARRERLKQMLNNNLNEFLQNMRSMDDAGWQALCEFVDFLTVQARRPDFWDHIEARKKILLGLIRRREQAAALEFLAHQGWHRDHFRGRAAPDRDTVTGVFPLEDRLHGLLDADAFTLSDTETAATAAARRLIPTPDGARLSVIAYINRILPQDVESLRFLLTHRETGTVQELAWQRPAEAEPDTRQGAATQEAGTVHAEDVVGHTRRYADMREAIVDLILPAGLFAADGHYSIHAVMSSGGVHRECGLDYERYTESMPPLELAQGRVLRAFLGADDPARQQPGTHPLVFTAGRPAAVLHAVHIAGDVAHVSVAGRDLASIVLIRDGDRRLLQRAAAPLRRAEPAGRPAGDDGRDGDARPGVWAGQIRLPRRRRRHHRNVFRAVVTDTAGGTHDVYVPERLVPLLHEDEPGRFAAQRRPARRARHLPKIELRSRLDARAGAGPVRPGAVDVGTVPRGVPPQPALAGDLAFGDRAGCFLVTDVAVDGDTLTLHGVPVEGTPRIASLEIAVKSTSFSVPVTPPAQAGPVAVRVPLTGAPFGLPTRILPSGSCTLRMRSGTGSEIPLTVSTRLARRLPSRTTLSRVRVHLSRQHDTSLGLTLSAPLQGDEAGLGNRWRLRDWSYALPAKQRRRVLFRNLYGEAANDSALAVHKELLRRGTDLELVWAVRDHSVPIPEGARAVVEETREYYEAFGTASHIMVNVHQPDWFVKKPGQVVVETFHGYPFKLNGYRWWQRLGWTAERRESLLSRADDWDYLVSPAAYATPLLKEFFHPDREITTQILEIGYPRNDALLAPDADAVRERVRSRLGILPGQRAVLYAPTFRDYVSPDDMRAAMVEFVDLAKLARRLGDDHVLLLRGHPFNARTGTQADGRVVNVTDYPDINDLILASDMAVLDYSSLRFDYALTGKPALFFVPDREQYFRGREGLLSYDATTPGPQITRGADLYHAIMEADLLGARFEPARQEFVARFMELEDGHATERLVDRVFGPAGAGRAGQRDAARTRD